jgi:ketosteroid isomerase-like protein
MSEENLELARQYVETFNERGLDGVKELWHPQIEVFEPPTFPDAGQYHGPEAVCKVVEGYLSLGWDGCFREPEYIDAGEEILVVWTARWAASAHGGGVELDQAFSHLYLFEAGNVRRIRQFVGRDEGFEAAGLSE